ncbi:MAG: NAD(P)-binding domain-containing protein [Acidobacteriia bacterium]|nr:NAD(P)-binding domain-containing protein [Terriglobia bacterium]
MNDQRIVSTAPIDKIAIDILEKVAPVEVSPSSDEATLLTLLDNTVGIVARGTEGSITQRIIEECESLKVIGRPGVGYDTVDVEFATKCGIPVIYAPVGGFAVAEGALALLMAIVKKIALTDSILKSGEWQRRYEFNTGDLTGHTLGIIGLGRIGARLAKLVQNFEMTVLGYDPFLDKNSLEEVTIELVELEELLQQSDFVSVHVPLSEHTRGLIDKKRIEQMKPGAIFINTARGGVVENLDILADGLESGHLGAVGLDVFPTEPPDCTHRLFQNSQFFGAPHLLGVSELAMERIYRSMASDMVAVLQGQLPKYCVNPEVISTIQ